MKFHSYLLAVIGLVSAAATAHAVGTIDIDDGAVTTPKLATGAVTTTKIKNAAVTSAKLAANALDRPVDIIWLESDGTTWNLAAKYRNLDGQLDAGYRKVPFSAANNIDFGITSSMTFDDATDSVTINKEGLYAFRFRSATLAGASASGEYLPIHTEINIVRGESRMPDKFKGVLKDYLFMIRFIVRELLHLSGSSCSEHTQHYQDMITESNWRKSNVSVLTCPPIRVKYSLSLFTLIYAFLYAFL